MAFYAPAAQRMQQLTAREVNSTHCGSEEAAGRQPPRRDAQQVRRGEYARFVHNSGVI